MTVVNFCPSEADIEYQLSFINSLREIKQSEWNSLLDDDHPFLRFEFLSALENNDCLGEKFGWYPHHLVVRDKNNILIAATPLYIKTNSYGEFVFDWSWASAYDQAGLNYYPKLVSSIPYTPVMGKRLLIATHMNPILKAKIAQKMITTCIDEAKKVGMSGMHWLFNDYKECDDFEKQKLMFRLGCQYHWHNQNYKSFEHYLESFISRKRKKIKQERRYVKEQDIEIVRLHGSETDDALWEQIHSFYTSTFYRKSGIPTLSLGFFKEVGITMGSQILLVLAYKHEQLVACAIYFSSSKSLYGRFWGCLQNFNSLHFEACYYQGIEYAIKNNLKTFEPGAQGEHKIRRGFLPTKTWSAHWIADDRFEPAIRDFCKREKEFMQVECKELMRHSPFKIN